MVGIVVNISRCWFWCIWYIKLLHKGSFYKVIDMEKAACMVDFWKSREQVFKFINHHIIVGGVVTGNAEDLGTLLALFKYVYEG